NQTHRRDAEHADLLKNKSRRALRLGGEIVFLLFCVCVSRADQPEPLPKLRERAESSRGGDRARLFLDAARREMEAADEQFTAGNPERGQVLVKDALTDTEKSADAAIQSGHRLKQTELDLRK